MTDDHPAPTVDHPAPMGNHPDPIPSPNLFSFSLESPVIDTSFPIDYTIITGDHPAPTVDHPAPMGTHPDPIPSPNLSSLTLAAPVIDTGFPIHYTIITGWNRPSLLLFVNGVISLLWGIALGIFSSGVVPVDWVISQYGQKHPDIINTITTLIATASTRHLAYTFQGVLELYSYYALVDGFTLSQLKWMQGIKEVSFFTAFKFEGRLKWTRGIVWLLVWGAMAFHSASVVSVLQPNNFVKTLPYNNAIPCATDPETLSLDVLKNIPEDIQSQIDQSSYEIGLQLGNYVAQVSGNTTTSVAGRVYAKDNYAYGALGYNHDSLQETPGVQFNACCAGEPNTPNDTDLWASVFPGRSPPMIIKLSNGSQSFSDQPIPSQLQSIVSDPVFNFNGSEVGMYSLIYPSGTGGLVLANASGPILECIWRAIPQLVSVQIVNYTAGTLGSQDSEVVPQLSGRAVLLTLQGMAQAVRNGGNLNANNRPDWLWTVHVASTSTVLQTLIADGGKAALTVFNDYFSYQQGLEGFSVCNNHNRNVNVHWRFGNHHNLGWIAIIGTAGGGVLTIVAVIWFTRPRQRRVQGINPLEVAHAYLLPQYVVVKDGVRDSVGNPVLRIEDVGFGRPFDYRQVDS